jgi:hypothetical protein
MRPENYPVSSPASRAAVRLQLARSKASRKRLRLVLSAPRPRWDSVLVSFGPWQECPDGTLCQLIYVPHVWLKPGDATPICPACNAPFKKTHEYPTMIGFEASCVNEHDPERTGIITNFLSLR